MRLETWNVKTGSVKTVWTEWPKYKTGLVQAQGVRHDKGGSEPADAYTLLYGNGINNHHLAIDCFVHKESHQQLRQPVSDRMSYKILSHDRVWLQKGFGLITQFMAHFDTARDYTLQFSLSLSLSHECTHARAHTHTHTQYLQSHFIAAAW
jgi:hypothetical protein